MKNIILIILLFVFGSEIIAQGIRVGIGHDIGFLPQGFSSSLLSGYGCSTLYNDVSNINSMNPASLDIFNQIEIGISYQLQTEINDSWLANIRSERISNFVPQSVGIIFPYNNLNLAVAMNQKYNRAISSEPVAIVTSEHPSGTGEFIEIKYKTQIFNYSISASYTFKEILKKSEISVGLRTGLSHLHQYNKHYRSELDENLYTSELAIGAVFVSKQTEKEYLKFGLFYEFALNFEKRAKFTSNENQVIDNDGRNPNFYSDSDIMIRGKLPSTVRFDFDLSSLEKIKILGGISNVFWSSISDGYKNQIELFGSFAYEFNDFITSSIGFMYTDREYLEDYFEISQNLNAVYLNAGIVTNYSNFKVHFVFADSHLFSGEWRKETLLKLILNYNL